MVIRTLSPIADGEFVCIPYCCLFTAAVARRRHLADTYFFTCACERCKRDEGAPNVPGLARRASALMAEALLDGAEARAAAACLAAVAALESAVAPLVAAGAEWARLVLARARWWRLQLGGSGVDAEALGAELSWLLGDRHPFTRQVRGFTLASGRPA